MTICNLATRSLLYGCLPTHLLTHYTWFAVELQTLHSSMQQWFKEHHETEPIFIASVSVRCIPVLTFMIS